MPFIDELDQLLDDLIAQKLSEHIASVGNGQPLPAPAQEALSQKFSGARRQFKEAYSAELEREALCAEIDSLRARLDALEGA